MLTTGADIKALVHKEDYGLGFSTSVTFIAVYISISLAMVLHYLIYRDN